MRSCRQTTCRCDQCGGRYTLGELAHLLDDDAFSVLSGLVDDRPADRV